MQKILTILSEYGYWGEELVGPVDVLERAGFQCVFATPKGGRAPVLPPSTDPTYVDPPLGRPVVSESTAARVKAFAASNRLDAPLNIREMMPERPYLSRPNYLAELEGYYHALEDATQSLSQYAGLLLVGGSGPLVDMVNNQRVHDIVLAFHKMDKPIAAECYGVTILAFARDVRSRQSLIKGKRVTGHPIEYDYKDGTGFCNVDMNFGPPPFPLEYILRDAVQPDGEYFGNVGNRTSVIVDYPFITSRSTASSVLCGEKLVEVLQKGLRRWGW